jgi:glycosyltransferase involved in cell wall biosynthesis
MNTEVAIDARWLVGGIGTYTRHLLQGLRVNGNGFRVHAITREQHKHEVEKYCERVTVVNTPIYTVREQWAIPRAARCCDLLHVPHYNAPLLRRAPLVVTLHDIIHATDPDYRASFKSWAYARPILNLVARKARHIITDSEFSKSQIVEHLGVPASKVTMIYCGVNGGSRVVNRREAFDKVSATLGFDQPYLLYVGSLKRYKNVSTLLKAFAVLRERRHIPHHLIIVGDDMRQKMALLREAAELGIDRESHFISNVSEELLSFIYTAAEVCVMPSRIEGFGLPVLEAMSSGTPVVCSRAASLPEVGGDAVLYFDPASVEELIEALEQLLGSTELQRDLRKQGLERAAQFTWDKSARKHIEVYTRVLEES